MSGMTQAATEFFFRGATIGMWIGDMQVEKNESRGY